MGIIGQNIKKARKEKGITQKKLGEILGVSQAAIGQFENEKSNPKIETLEKIASALEIPLALLLSAESEDMYDSMTSKEFELHQDMYCVSVLDDKFIKEIMQCFAKLNDTGKQKVADYANDLCLAEQYLKDYWKIKKYTQTENVKAVLQTEDTNTGVEATGEYIQRNQDATEDNSST